MSSMEILEFYRLILMRLPCGMSALNTAWGLNTDLGEIVGNGPFIPVELNLGKWVTLKKNPYYFQKDANGLPLPYLSAVRLVKGDSATLFNSGDADLCAVTGADRLSIDRNGAMVINTGPFSAIVIAMNQNLDVDGGGGDDGIIDPQYTWFTTAEFRQAIAHIVNRARIVTEAFSGYGSPVYSPVHSSSPYYWSGVEPGGASPVPVYDIAEANTLLDNLGCVDSGDAGIIRENPPGTNISFTMRAPPGDQARIDICDIIAEEALAIGIEILVDSDGNNMVDSLPATENWETACLELTSYLDPAALNNIIPSYGGLHLSEPNKAAPQDWEIPADAAWVTVMETADGSARADALQTIQQIWAPDDVPWIYVAAENVYEAYRDDLANVSSDVLHPFDGQGWRAIIASPNNG